MICASCGNPFVSDDPEAPHAEREACRAERSHLYRARVDAAEQWGRAINLKRDRDDLRRLVVDMAALVPDDEIGEQLKARASKLGATRQALAEDPYPYPATQSDDPEKSLS